MKKRSKWVYLLSLCLVGSSAALSLSACGGDDESNSGAGGSGGSGGTSGGQLDHPCQPKADECYIAGKSGPGALCLARHDNSSASVIQLRVSQLELASPAALKQPFLQNTVITQKITPDSSSCYQFGEGQFNILFEWNTETMKVKQGAAPPQGLVGPLHEGTCYADFIDPPSGAQVAPVEADFTVDGDTYRAVFKDVAIPIYLENDTKNYALLPMHELEVTAKLSEDKNCVGRYAPENLDETQICAAKPGLFAYENGGSYKGYVTVTEADTVNIDSLGYSLCVLLSGNVGRWRKQNDETGIGHCEGSRGFEEEGGLPKGNWCAATNSAATDSCHDAWLIESQYAASAVKIDGICAK